jgi:hypothetical protein
LLWLPASLAGAPIRNVPAGMRAICSVTPPPRRSVNRCVRVSARARADGTMGFGKT